MMQTGRPFRTTRDIVNLRQGRNDWYRIANATATAPARIDIFDEIGWFGVTASDFVRDLGGVSGDLEVHMNCPGGDVFEGVAIYNALLNHDGTVTVHVDGLAASAASFIAQAASPGQLVIAKTASMMIHDAFGLAIGNATDMRQMADVLDQQSDNIAGIYADRSGKPRDEWRTAMRAETWYVGQQAVDAGLADRVQGQAVDNSWDLSVFRNARNASSAVDESPWDASKAWHNGTEADDPAAFYRGICAGEKNTGDPATQAHWALPHHYHPGDAPNRHGVSAALGRIGSTDGLANEAAARAHLEAHQSAMGDGNSSSDNSVNLDWLDQEAFIKAFKEATK